MTNQRDEQGRPMTYWGGNPEQVPSKKLVALQAPAGEIWAPADPEKCMAVLRSLATGAPDRDYNFAYLAAFAVHEIDRQQEQLRGCSRELAIERRAAQRTTHEPPADAHPEAFCELCGRPNACWFAPSEIWNVACGDRNIICPVCFIKLTEAAGIKPTSWLIAPEGYSAQPSCAHPNAVKGTSLAGSEYWMCDCGGVWTKDPRAAQPPSVNHDESVLMLQDAEDAKRYRWIRDNQTDAVLLIVDWDLDGADGDELDTAIDSRLGITKEVR